MDQPPVDPTEFFDGNDRVLALMNMRRRGGDPMQNANEIRANLCNKVQGLVRSVPGLRDRIVAISEVDPELSAYIMALESINNGIWCPTCKVVKRLGGAPSEVNAATTQSQQSQSTQQTQSQSVSNEQLLECTKLQTHFRSAKEEMSLLANEYAQMKNRMDLLTIKLDSYAARINTLMSEQGKVAPSVEQRIKRTMRNTEDEVNIDVQSVDMHNVQNDQSSQNVQSSQPTTRQSVFAGLKKEDLPPAPELEINFTFDSSSTADSLLE